MDNMKNDIRYFIAQIKANILNAHALRSSFWIGVFSMMLNDVAFFVIWILFMKATGPINGWTGLDVFGMIGVSTFCFGVVNSFFYGIRELPESVARGSFDSVLLAPVDSFLKLSGSAFSITGCGDLLLGFIVSIFYGIIMHFSLYSWVVFILAIIVGCIIFTCVRLCCSLIAFFIHDGEIVATQVFEIFLRPGLYPGGIFPSKMKLFFMTVVPTLITSVAPIDAIKGNAGAVLLFSIIVTACWICFTYILYKIAVRRYESGNFLR
jgi:ABC-2 type transport system permease protein